MSKIETGGSAFPSGPNNAYGMTLRDYFAGQALSTYMADHAYLQRLHASAHNFGLEIDDMLAINAYELADAMLRARARTAHE